MKITASFLTQRAQRFLYIIENIFKSRKGASLSKENRKFKKYVCHSERISAFRLLRNDKIVLISINEKMLIARQMLKLGEARPDLSGALFLFSQKRKKRERRADKGAQIKLMSFVFESFRVWETLESFAFFLLSLIFL